jgi:hypothetical protein
LLGLALIWACSASAVRASISKQDAGQDRLNFCGPSTARSVAASEGIRIFRADSKEPRVRSDVRVCSRTSGSTLGLGRNVVVAPFAITAPWAGAVELRGEGQDFATVSVVAVDVVTARRSRCEVGGANRPGQLPKVKNLWSTDGGAFVALVVRHLEPVGPEIVTCSRSSMQIVAQGPAIKAASVEVQGSVVSWTEEGTRHSVHL